MSPSTTNGSQTSATPGTEIPAMAQLSFLVDIPGHEIGRFAECSGLAVEYDVMEYAEGGNNQYVHQLRGRVRYPNVVLGRGVTHEDELLQWFFKAEQQASRPTVTVTLLDPLGAPVRHFALAEAVPVRWTGPQGASGSDVAATESLEISHGGFV